MNTYYMVGIKGAGMSALASILFDMGHRVIGYDDTLEHRFTEAPLEERQIPIYHDETFPISRDTTLIFSSAVPRTHHELLRAEEAGAAVLEYHEMLGQLSALHRTICVAGCHGKTTTTSLLAHILADLQGCSYLIGDSTGYVTDRSDLFVLESCEYKRHFLAYTPEYAIVTNIELDHTDYYKDIDDMLSAYQSFALKAKKACIFYGEDPYTRSLQTKVPTYFYGLASTDDFQAVRIEMHPEGTDFEVLFRGESLGRFHLKQFGEHMILNALCAIAVAYLEGNAPADIARELSTFTGAKRRFEEEVIGSRVIVGDYAHHPSELAVTLKTARQKYPDKTLIAIFKPNTFSRTVDFREEFIDALNLADKAYVMDINYDREDPADYPGVTPYTIIDGLRNGEYIELGMSDKLLAFDNAVFCFMSCKEVYLIENEFKEKLKAAK